MRRFSACFGRVAVAEAGIDAQIRGPNSGSAPSRSRCRIPLRPAAGPSNAALPADRSASLPQRAGGPRGSGRRAGGRREPGQAPPFPDHAPKRWSKSLAEGAPGRVGAVDGDRHARRLRTKRGDTRTSVLGTMGGTGQVFEPLSEFPTGESTHPRFVSCAALRSSAGQPGIDAPLARARRRRPPRRHARHCDVDVARGTDGRTWMAVAAQGLAWDKVRDFKRIYVMPID